MIGSIERVWRHMSVQSLMPVMVVVISSAHPTDPARKNVGFGGVIPVPAPPPGPVASASRTDVLVDQQHRDQRAARGRILYAAGHAPQAPSAAVRAEVKPTCDRRVVQAKTNPAPNS